MSKLLPATPACWTWLPIPDRCPTIGGLRAWQQGRCAICGGVPARPLVLDHDHVTLLVRGWLCESCNLIEGRKDLPVIVAYRVLSPAVICGLVAKYAPGAAQPEPDPAPAGPPGPARLLLGLARWCETHNRAECAKNRSKGRGPCHAQAITGTDTCQHHAGVTLERARAKGRAALAARAAAAPDDDRGLTPLAALAALLAGLETAERDRMVRYANATYARGLPPSRR